MFTQHSETHYHVHGVGGDVRVRATNTDEGWLILVNGEEVQRLERREGLTPETLRAEAISAAVKKALEHYDEKVSQHARMDTGLHLLKQIVEKQEGIDRIILELHRQESFSSHELNAMRTLAYARQLCDSLDAATDD